MIIGRIFDYLLMQGEGFGQNINAIIQVAIILLWIFIIKRLKTDYKTSLAISLFLILLSSLVLTLSFVSQAGLIGQYAFIFLMVGVIQSVLQEKTIDS